ncbi:MAG TPA: aromatic ring-hydroxylating dioxygenase subunit alpha [Flavitalea sp.]|nr:aromatic ring-hydroxylating dioxygenase subunit alpha [Flavitalea sp.]
MDLFYVDPDIRKARTLHKSFYLDHSLFEQCRELIFLPSWQFLADKTLLARSCEPVVLLPGYLDEPVIVTRNNSGDLHCVSNVCTHRGNILVNESSNSTNIRCRYHGRLFRLDGQFVSMPEFSEVCDFPTEADNLRQFPVDRIGNLLFTSPGNAVFSEYFGDMLQRISFLPLEEFRLDHSLSKTFEVNAHWALYCENYLEGFHIPFVHATLNAVIDYGNYTTELFSKSNLQLAIAKPGEPVFDLPESSIDFGKRVAAYYFFVFPNLMFNFYPWGLSLNIVEPVSESKTKVRFLTYMWKPELHDSGAGSGLHQVEMEDEEVVEAVQQGIRSRFYEHGRYSVTRETGTHHFHRLLSAALSQIPS